MTIQSIRLQFETHRRAGLAGDPDAAARLSASFGAGLVRFVRRVVRKGTGRGSLAEFVLNEASRLQAGYQAMDPDDLVGEIVDRICALVAGQDIAVRLETVALKTEETASVRVVPQT